MSDGSLCVLRFLTDLFLGVCMGWFSFSIGHRCKNRTLCSGCGLFPFPNVFSRFVDEKDFRKLQDNSSLHLAHQIFVLRGSQGIDRFKSSCVGLYPYSLCKGAAEQVEAFTVLGCKGGWKSFENCNYVIVGRLLPIFWCLISCGASRDEVPSRQANDSGAPASSPDYYANVDAEAKCDFADLNATEDPVEHTVLKAKLAEIQGRCRRFDIAVPSS